MVIAKLVYLAHGGGDVYGAAADCHCVKKCLVRAFGQNGFLYVVIINIRTRLHKHMRTSFRQILPQTALKILAGRKPACGFLPTLQQNYARKSAHISYEDRFLTLIALYIMPAVGYDSTRYTLCLRCTADYLY